MVLVFLVSDGIYTKADKGQCIYGNVHRALLFFFFILFFPLELEGGFNQVFWVRQGGSQN